MGFNSALKGLTPDVHLPATLRLITQYLFHNKAYIQIPNHNDLLKGKQKQDGYHAGQELCELCEEGLWCISFFCLIGVSGTAVWLIGGCLVVRGTCH
jgi:hypothetical protein